MRFKIRFKDICKQNGIILAYLFGSQAQNGYKVLNGERVVQKDPLADLDLGIILDDEGR
ncbi:MAG: nucleotidyltransferase domain-containing protein, partial [Desulfotomaculum sp.]|nr:nucleotidyltransferase domain-containing protein [Desulfotomaculum sp.]